MHVSGRLTPHHRLTPPVIHRRRQQPPLHLRSVSTQPRTRMVSASAVTPKLDMRMASWVFMTSSRLRVFVMRGPLSRRSYHKRPAAILCRNLTRTPPLGTVMERGSTDDQIRARTAHFGSNSASLPARRRACPKCHPGGNHRCHGPRRSSRASGVRHFRCQNSRRKDGPQSTYGHNRLRAEQGIAFL